MIIAPNEIENNGLDIQSLTSENTYLRDLVNSSEEFKNAALQHKLWERRLRRSHELIAMEKQLSEYYVEQIGQVDVAVTLRMEQVADENGISADTLRNTNKKLHQMGVIIYEVGEAEKLLDSKGKVVKGSDGKPIYNTPVKITLNYLVYMPEQIKKLMAKAGGARKRRCKSCQSEDIDRYAVEYCRDCQTNHILPLPGIRSDANVYEMVSSMALEEQTRIDPRLNNYAVESVAEEIDQAPPENAKHYAFTPDEIAALDRELDQLVTDPPEQKNAKHNAFGSEEMATDQEILQQEILQDAKQNAETITSGYKSQHYASEKVCDCGTNRNGTARSREYWNEQEQEWMCRTCGKYAKWCNNRW